MQGDGRDSAAVVLAGGRSSRMGMPKAALEWYGSTLLYRTASVLKRTVNGPVVVSSAPGQELPRLPAGVAVVEDPVEGLGPMQGIANGLAAVADRAPVAFVCSTDLPFLHPAFVAAVLRILHARPEADVVLPVVRGFRQPLAAGYRTGLFGLIAERVAAGDRRPGLLFEHCRVEQLGDDDLLADRTLARVDGTLDSVVNVNDPADYAAARQRPAPGIVVERFGALAVDGHRGPRTVRAATLDGAARGADLVLDRHVLAAVNGDEFIRDPEFPLAEGDGVAFLTADGGG